MSSTTGKRWDGPAIGAAGLEARTMQNTEATRLCRKQKPQRDCLARSASAACNKQLVAILVQPECMCCKAEGTAILYSPHAFMDARRDRSTARGDHRAPRKASAATCRNRHDATLARGHLLPKRMQRHRQCTWQKQRKDTQPSKHIGASVQSLSEHRRPSPKSSSESGGVLGA